MGHIIHLPRVGMVEEAEHRGNVLAKLETVDVPRLAQDVLPFLSNPVDADRIRLFPECIRTAPLRV